MKLGCFIPQMGPAATPGQHGQSRAGAPRSSASTRVWVTDRLLFPVNPKTPYAAEPGRQAARRLQDRLRPAGGADSGSRRTRSKIRIGTSVLDMPFYNPILLARRTSAIDAALRRAADARHGPGLVAGRVRGDERRRQQARQARGRVPRRCCTAIWKNDPAEFNGKYFQLAKSYIDPKPVQKPHPPVYLAAFAPGAMKRVARFADGWHPVGLPFAGDAADVGRDQGRWRRRHGRNPDDLKLIVRGNLHLTRQAAGEGRWTFTGNWDEIKQDIAAAPRAERRTNW